MNNRHAEVIDKFSKTIDNALEGFWRTSNETLRGEIFFAYVEMASVSIFLARRTLGAKRMDVFIEHFRKLILKKHDDDYNIRFNALMMDYAANLANATEAECFSFAAHRLIGRFYDTADAKEDEKNIATCFVKLSTELPPRLLSIMSEH